MLRPKKKIKTRNLITKKKFLRLKNSPSPPPTPPHNFSNGLSLNSLYSQEKRQVSFHTPTSP